MEELKACPLPCNLDLLNDRINNLSAGLIGMGEKETMSVNKKFLTAVLDYMEELLGLRLEEENRRAAPENKPLTLPSVSDRDRQSMYDFLHDCFAEWINDPQVGLIGMNEGESTLANAIMDALRPEAAP